MTIVAVQMDAIETIDVETDTSFALALEAQKRGYRLFYYQPKELFYEEGLVKARGHFCRLIDQNQAYFSLEPEQILSLKDAAYVLIRQNPPFDLAYITTTHLLDLLPSTTTVINNPQGVRDAPEKLLVTHFNSLIPPTLITRSFDDIKLFLKNHKTAVLKPLFDFGGNGVLKIYHHDPNLQAIVELYQRIYKEPFVVQKFLPEVADGDKRILLINGDPVGIFKRIPSKENIRSNIRIGGKAQKCVYTSRDQEICKTIGPVLRKMGLHFVGIDVIGDFLTEINVTSPTGMRVMNRLYTLDLATNFWDTAKQINK